MRCDAFTLQTFLSLLMQRDFVDALKGGIRLIVASGNLPGWSCFHPRDMHIHSEGHRNVKTVPSQIVSTVYCRAGRRQAAASHC
jgi:hypothetical protein